MNPFDTTVQSQSKSNKLPNVKAANKPGQMTTPYRLFFDSMKTIIQDLQDLVLTTYASLIAYGWVNIATSGKTKIKQTIE